MIAQRFRPVAWVLGVACAATLLYSVSLRVANERARLDALEEKITLTKRDIRRLQTELGSRSSLRQLERWNGEALALTAPTAKQFMSNETQLSRLDASGAPVKGYVPAPVLLSTVTVSEMKEDSKPEGEAKSSQEQVAMLDRTLTNAPEAKAETMGAKSPAKPMEKAKP